MIILVRDKHRIEMTCDEANSGEVGPISGGKSSLLVEELNSSSQPRRPHPAPPARLPVVSSARQNNIGFIRLLAASMVIVSHSPELINGDRFKEPLTRLFGTLSFGELGVNIFFLISGYLITKSYLSGGRLSYLARRVARIYPGYVVAYLLCVFVVAPIAGVTLSSLSRMDDLKIVFHALWLDMPPVKGAFATQHYHYLNGAMWTISYEFRCYLFVMLAGVLGFYKRRSIPVFLAISFLLLHLSIANDFNPRLTGWFILKEVLFGNVVELTRFMFVFSCGSLFYVFRDKIKYTGSAAFLCALGLMVFAFSDRLAEPALCTLGAYVLFSFAFATKQININNRYDISYGLYLYAWPTAALILLRYPAIAQVNLSVFTFIFAAFAGTISWYMVERPALRWCVACGKGSQQRGDGSAMS
jgi:peptidoglycan/LPS O-acetylase OafA/YrhL